MLESNVFFHRLEWIEKREIDQDRQLQCHLYDELNEHCMTSQEDLNRFLRLSCMHEYLHRLIVDEVNHLYIICRQ